MEANTINELSQQEKIIIENKSQYISLEEETSNSVDITEELLDLTNKFSLGEMIHTPDFTLAETMSSVELNHVKMDPHFNNREANTFTKLLREQRVKKIEDLTYREVNLKHLFT
jgi:hypothetical protein